MLVRLSSFIQSWGLPFPLPVVDAKSLWPVDLCPSVSFGRGITIVLSLAVGGLLGLAGVDKGVLFLTQQKAAIGQRPAHLHLMDVEALAGAVLHWDLLNDLHPKARLSLGLSASLLSSTLVLLELCLQLCAFPLGFCSLGVCCSHGAKLCTEPLHLNFFLTFESQESLIPALHP